MDRTFFRENSPADQERLRRLFIIKRTEAEMISQRGFSLKENVYMLKWTQTVQNWVPVDLSWLLDPVPPNDFIQRAKQWRETNGLCQTRQEFSSLYFDPATGKSLAVIYLTSGKGKSGNDDLKIYTTMVSAENSPRHYILITKTGLSSDSERTVSSHVSVKVEVFLDQELAFPRVKHALAPISIVHHPAEEAAQWAEDEGLTREKLPLMLDSEPIAKWYGAKPWDAFEMVLLGMTTDTIGYYRLVRTTPAK